MHFPCTPAYTRIHGYVPDVHQIGHILKVNSKTCPDHALLTSTMPHKTKTALQTLVVALETLPPLSTSPLPTRPTLPSSLPNARLNVLQICQRRHLPLRLPRLVVLVKERVCEPDASGGIRGGIKG